MGVATAHCSAIMKLLLVVLCAFVGSALCDRLPYIVGGKDVDHAGKYPWQASLQTRGWIFGGQHICGASLVSKTWLVTAAHCVQGQSPSGLQVVMGLHDKDTKRQGQPDTYYIRRLIGHPGFGRGGRAMPNDIALIQLAEPVDLSNPFVSTIQMADHMENFEGNKDASSQAGAPWLAAGAPLMCCRRQTLTCGTCRRVTVPMVSVASPTNRCASARRARAAAATETPAALWCARLETHGSWLEQPPGESPHAVPTTPPSTRLSLTSDPGSISTPAFKSFFFNKTWALGL